jgi:SAM-dependent methyltransferase
LTAGFKDHFSGHADSYAAFRPHYPPSLFEYLAGLCAEHIQAWDCATGNGQAARRLAPFFANVIATDASEQQIANASPCDKVEFRMAAAESSGLENHSVDLVTVAQALHWFDIDAFFAECQRVLKPGGVLAAWSYANCYIERASDGECNETVEKIFAEVEDFWPPERKIVAGRYRSITLPFPEISADPFAMRASWQAGQMLGYMRTWSASQRYLRANGTDPTELFADELKRRWGPGQREVCWPLTLKVGKK